MNKIKKLSIVLIVLAMCAVLGMTAWASVTNKGVEYSAKLNKDALCVSDQAQTVTVTFAADKEVDMFILSASVVLPENWSVSFSQSPLQTRYTESNGVIISYNKDSDLNDSTTWTNAKSIKTFVTMTVTVPAGTAAGEYELGLTSLSIAKLVPTVNEDADLLGQAELTTTLTIREHRYVLDTAKGTDGYTWSGAKETTACTAHGKCEFGCGATTTAQATVTPQVTTPATCETKGATTYTATFIPAWTTKQVKVVDDIPSKGHAYPATPVYTNDGDSHTETFVCGNDSKHVITNTGVSHDFTNGDCVCGKKKGLKGDVNLDGNVDMDDVVALMSHVLSDVIITDSVALDNGEVTNNTDLNMDDVVKLMRYVLSDITTLD